MEPQGRDRGAAPAPEAWIVGAGSVGLALGARLARAGSRVAFATRRPEAAAALERDGLEAEDPETGEVLRLPVRARSGLPAATGEAAVFFLCTGSRAVARVGPGLAALRPPPAALVSLQNDVSAEPTLAALEIRVIGGVWRETCTRVADHRVRLQLRHPGRVVVGLHPEGRDPAVERTAALLRRAGLDVGVSEHIAEDKWLKLCSNLTSAPNALVRRPDHTTAAFVEVKARLLEEARTVLSAAGVSARSCDGRDPSLDEQIARHRASLAQGRSARPIPLYNQAWAELRRGDAPEAADYHRRVLDLARRVGIDAPVNRLVLRRLLEANASGRGPECLAAADLLPD